MKQWSFLVFCLANLILVALGFFMLKSLSPVQKRFGSNDQVVSEREREREREREEEGEETERKKERGERRRKKRESD